MKALLLLSIGFFLASSPALSQDTNITGKKIRLHKGDRVYTHEYLVFYKGQLIHHVNGRNEVVDSAFILHNDTEVHPDGQYRPLNGLIYKLRNGEYLDMEGNRYSSVYNFNVGKMMTVKEINRVQDKIGNK